MSDQSVKSAIVSMLAAHSSPEEVLQRFLKNNDGGGNSGDMNTDSLGERVAKIEGGWTTFQWACAVVTALFIAAFAILLTVQVWTAGQVSALTTRVDALPNEINQNLIELNKALTSAITASKNTDGDQIRIGLSQQELLLQIQKEQADAARREAETMRILERLQQRSTP